MGKKFCTAVVLAAGQGKRMGGRVAKQYLEVGGKPLLYYALSAFEKVPFIDSIVLTVGDAGQISYCKREILDVYGFQKVDILTVGGKERFDSVRRALEAIGHGVQADGAAVGSAARLEALRAHAKDGYVFIHDGARPVVSQDILRRCLDAVEKYGACAAAMPAKDTVKIADARGFAEYTPNRDLVWTMQTPQTFAFSLIDSAYQKLEEERPRWEKEGLRITDDAMAVETFLKQKVKLVEGSYENLKVTTPEDLVLAELFLRENGQTEL